MQLYLSNILQFDGFCSVNTYCNIISYWSISNQNQIMAAFSNSSKHQLTDVVVLKSSEKYENYGKAKSQFWGSITEILYSMLLFWYRGYFCLSTCYKHLFQWSMHWRAQLTPILPTSTCGSTLDKETVIVLQLSSSQLSLFWHKCRWRLCVHVCVCLYINLRKRQS